MSKLKAIIKWILILAALCIAAYGIFYASEYFKGGSYVDYLQANKESVGLEESFTFDICEQDLQEKSLILVGEIHGFEEPAKFDVDFYRHLRTQFDVVSYLVEMDYSQAYFLNEFNRTGDRNILERVLQNWVVNPGRNNRDYLNKWIDLQRLYQKQPFEYYGINNISDIGLLVAHLNEITEEELVKPDASKSDSLVMVEVKGALERLSADTDSTGYSAEVAWDIRHLQKNVDHWLEDANREEVLSANLMELYDHFNLKEEKVYGFFGLGHTLMNKLEGGYEPMAYKIKQMDPWFENEILSMNFVFCDSYMVMPSKSLPGILRDQGAYTRLPVSYDNIWLAYLYGIEDLKRVTEEESKTIFKLDGKGSPYKESNRLFSMFKILPVGQVINAGEGLNTADLAQYLIFVRDSDWAEPFQD